MLLVEPSAYNTDLVAPPVSTKQATARKPRQTRRGQQNPPQADNAETAPTPARTAASKKLIKEYAIAHGLSRGGLSKNNAVPDGPQPRLDIEATDEGLLTLIQSVTCRRTIMAEVFDSPKASKSVFRESDQLVSDVCRHTRPVLRHLSPGPPRYRTAELLSQSTQGEDLEEGSTGRGRTTCPT